jgi:hypothetical protein
MKGAMRNMSRFLLGACVLAATASCHNPGPYGHAPNYAPLSEEETAVAGAREYDPVMFQRQPEEWRQKPSFLFGIVTARSAGPSGTAQLKLSVRRLEPRNLCANSNDEDSCRVTVSNRDFGMVTVAVSLKGEDDVGERSVGAGSLVRVTGTFGQEVDPQDGSPLLRGTYYRHFPRGYYVTSSAAEVMRQ